MNPLIFFKCLADQTRLLCVLLIEKEKELCVCDLTDALEVSQPKISRHLANLRSCGIVKTRKSDQWVFYSINPELDQWAQSLIKEVKESNVEYMHDCLTRLKNNKNRPECC